MTLYIYIYTLDPWTTLLCIPTYFYSTEILCFLILWILFTVNSEQCYSRRKLLRQVSLIWLPAALTPPPPIQLLIFKYYTLTRTLHVPASWSCWYIYVIYIYIYYIKGHHIWRRRANAEKKTNMQQKHSCAQHDIITPHYTHLWQRLFRLLTGKHLQVLPTYLGEHWQKNEGKSDFIASMAPELSKADSQADSQAGRARAPRPRDRTRALLHDDNHSDPSAEASLTSYYVE